jgi:putative membrane protein insertion efficiency factor
VLRSIVLGVIRFYQLALSPLKPPTCRFQPTCSSYAHEAVSTWGVLRGGWLFVRRFARCNPFGGEGYDPVPLRPETTGGAPDPSAEPQPHSDTP